MPEVSAVLTLERDDLAVRVDPTRGFWLVDRLTGSQQVWELPLPEVAREPAVARHRSADGGMVEEATWRDGTRVVVNRGEVTVCFRDLKLPPGGFCLDGPGFRAFHLLAGFGQSFQEPALFTIRSLDDLPLDESTKVQVFRGFGDRAVLIASVHGQMQFRSEVITREPEGFYVPVEREELVVFHDWYG